ncbi:unnamed protein product, partial [Meganyctiphanes norvegica]
GGRAAHTEFWGSRRATRVQGERGWPHEGRCGVELSVTITLVGGKRREGLLLPAPTCLGLSGKPERQPRTRGGKGLVLGQGGRVGGRRLLLHAVDTEDLHAFVAFPRPEPASCSLLQNSSPRGQALPPKRHTKKQA